MKKSLATYVVFFLITILLVTFFAVSAQAEFKVEFPMETNATAFWFPTDDTFAMGISHTVLRVSHPDIPKITLDFDGTLAKEVNADKDNLAGIGVKLAYNIQKVDKSGFAFIPSLGITALNNVKSFKTVLQDYRIAVYGTVILYKW